MYKSVFFLFCVLYIACAAGCKTTPAESLDPKTVLQITAQELFDFDSFKGERVKFRNVQPAFINNFHIAVQLPANHKMLRKAGPHVILFTQDNTFYKKFPLAAGEQKFLVYEQLDDETLYAVLSLFYCKEGSEGLCIIREVLFEMSLDRDMDPSDLYIQYQVPLIPFPEIKL